MEDKKGLIKSKKQMFIVISVFFLVMMLGTVTYAFFNYTRTGSVNNLGTGQIYFNTTEGPTLNLTNLFPMTSEEAGNANLDSVSVIIEGNTTYSDGEEYEISLVDVNNTINGKKIPINYIATYTAVSGKSVGEESDDYWNARNSKNADIYTLTETGKVEDGKQVLVGYIKNSASGIEGTLTIKAYIDADRIAISDTYNPNAVAPNSGSGTTPIPGTGEETSGTQTTNNLKKISPTMLASDLSSSGNPTTDEYGTTSEWVNGRTVLTTEEWNSFQTSGTPMSFKIRAESNEGIWVEEPSKGIESCPDCKFTYFVATGPEDLKWTTWNTQSQTPTQITSGLYDNYEELIATIGKNYFLGVKLNNNNEVTNAYACGVKDNIPFCIEGTSDGSKYTANQTLINGADLWNNTCAEDSYYTECGLWDNSGPVSANAGSSGDVGAGVGDDDGCVVRPYGYFVCVGSEDDEPDPSEPGGGD